MINHSFGAFGGTSYGNFHIQTQAPELATQYAHSQHQRGVSIAAAVVHEETPKDGP